MADERLNEEEIDAGLQAECEAQAAALGVSVDEYLNDLLLQTMLRQQVVAPVTEAAEAPVADSEAQLARQRLESIDRRLTVAVGNFESTVETMDRTLATLSARADDQDVKTERLGLRIEAALETLRESADLLEGRTTAAEQELAALAEAQDAAAAEAKAQYGALVQRLAVTLDDYSEEAEAERAAMRAHNAEFEAAVHAEFGRIARTVEEWRAVLKADVDAAFVQERTARAATDARLDETRQALTHARDEIRSDLRVVEARAEERLSQQGAEARTAIEAASQRAERAAEEAQRYAIAAAQRAAAEARSAREAVEERLIETAADVHGRIDAAQAESARLYEGLAERLGDSERATSARIADVRAEADAAAAGLGAELAEAREALAELRRTQQATNARLSEAGANAERVAAAMDADIKQTRSALTETQNTLTAMMEESAGLQRAVVDALEAKFDGEVADMRERHMGALARLKLFETNLGAVAADIGALAAQVEDGQQAAAVQLAEGVEALRLAASRQSQAVEAELTQLRSDVAAAEARAHEALAALSARASEELAAIRDLVTRELGELRSAQKGALARLDLTEEGLASVVAAQVAADALLQGVAERLDRTQTEFAALTAALTRLSDRTDSAHTLLAEHSSSLSRLDGVLARLDVHDADIGDLSERQGSLGRLVGKLSAQYTEATTSMQDRLHKLEVGLADARLDRMQPAGEGAYAALEERLNTIERRSLAALLQLTQTIAALNKRNAAQPADDEQLRSA